MKKKTLLAFYTTLNNFADVYGDSIMFAYGVDKNLRITKDEAESLKNRISPYEEEKRALVLAARKLDKDKKPVLDSNGTVVFKDKKKLEKDIAALDKKYEKTLKEFETLLEEEIELDFYKIPIESFDNLFVKDQSGKEIKVQLSARDLRVFEPMIK